MYLMLPTVTTIQHPLFALIVAMSLFSSTATAVDAGPLDNPLPTVNGLTVGVGNRPLTINPVAAQRVLRAAVEREQKELERLDRAALKEKAQRGERAAQVVLAADYAKEASLLSFAPAAANDALSDAARWYSLAASRGFPGAPSLDQAGIRFYPIRIQRESRR